MEEQPPLLVQRVTDSMLLQLFTFVFMEPFIVA